MAKRATRSAAEWERQSVRDASGQYAKMTPCYGGCGKGMSNQGNYWSHPLTDCLDAEGKGFADLGLMLCAKCAKATTNLTTVREFLLYVAAKKAAPDWVARKLASEYGLAPDGSPLPPEAR